MHVVISIEDKRLQLYKHIQFRDIEDISQYIEKVKLNKRAHEAADEESSSKFARLPSF